MAQQGVEDIIIRWEGITKWETHYYKVGQTCFINKWGR